MGVGFRFTAMSASWIGGSGTWVPAAYSCSRVYAKVVAENPKPTFRSRLRAELFFLLCGFLRRNYTAEASCCCHHGLQSFLGDNNQASMMMLLLLLLWWW